jgi:hypothetical protein
MRVAARWAPNRFYLLWGGPIGLQLRASNEHILIVRVPRAKETNGPLLLGSSQGPARSKAQRSLNHHHALPADFDGLNRVVIGLDLDEYA